MPRRRAPRPAARRLLPPWLARASARAGGAGLLALGLFLFAAFLSHTPADPSWNTAAPPGAPVANLAGAAGAVVSDLALQTLGAGAWVFAAVALAWGLRLLSGQGIAWASLRSIAALIAALAGAVAVAQVPAGWSLHPYAGGAVGTLALNAAAPLVPWALWVPAVTAAAGVLALASLAYACAVTRAEAGAAWRFVRDTALALWFAAAQAWAWLRGGGEQERAAPKKPRARKAPRPAEARTPPPVTSADAPPPAKTRAAPRAPPARAPVDTAWELPDLDLLTPPPADRAHARLGTAELRETAQELQKVLADFNVEGDIVGIHPGPVVTLYELEPAPGTKTARVIGLADDIARSMSVVSVRCAVVPGRNVIGIELPNAQRQTVYMHEMLACRLYERTGAKLPLILGQDIAGQPVLADLAKMPHLLVAGTTGSGKSVAINTMILSLLFSQPPERCRFIMIDPKMLELSVYGDIPHLLTPVVTEPSEAVTALKWAVAEMEQRYRAMARLGVRNIEGYNARLKAAADAGQVLTHKVQTGFDEDTGAPVYEEAVIDLTPLPYIVVIVDEFADLMLVAGKDVEAAIQRLAQMARAAGIHLIMATQRPSVDVITGVIKANFPTRISFAVTSKIDSRTILGEGGAEQLLGLGDMLYMAPGGRITRVHGPFVSDGDVEKVAGFLRDQGPPSYETSVTDADRALAGGGDVMAALFASGGEGGEGGDELYDRAVAVVAREGKASTSFIQRYLQIGYNRAARIIEEMERQGVIGPANATGKREVLVRDFSDV
jgi:DNA segregation ATPase FtsK/SpoIIIE, S-DNA-T family